MIVFLNLKIMHYFKKIIKICILNNYYIIDYILFNINRNLLTNYNKLYKILKYDNYMNTIYTFYKENTKNMISISKD